MQILGKRLTDICRVIYFVSIRFIPRGKFSKFLPILHSYSFQILDHLGKPFFSSFSEVQMSILECSLPGKNISYLQGVFSTILQWPRLGLPLISPSSKRSQVLYSKRSCKLNIYCSSYQQRTPYGLKLWSGALGQHSRSEHTENVSHLLWPSSLIVPPYVTSNGLWDNPVMSGFMACCIRRHPSHDKKLRLNVHLSHGPEQTFQVGQWQRIC